MRQGEKEKESERIIINAGDKRQVVANCALKKHVTCYR